MPAPAIALYPPPLPGLTFSVVRTPQFKQRLQRAVSGREMHSLQTPLPAWEWTLIYDFLRDNHDVRAPSPYAYNPAATAELRTLMNFYTAMQGSFSPFLFFDPTDAQVSFSVDGGGGIATGDGTTTFFPLVRELGDSGILEPVHAAIANDDAALKASAGITGTVAFNVYINGSLQDPGSYEKIFHAPPVTPLSFGDAIYAINFPAAPPSGARITVDMTYLWPVRFKMDATEFEYFMLDLWGVKELKLQSFPIPTASPP